MKRKLLFLLMCVLSFCSCKTNHTEDKYILETTEKIPVKPHSPSPKLSLEDRIAGTQKAINGLSNAYKKMQSMMEAQPTFEEGIHKAEEIKTLYGTRFEEILSLNIHDLTETELIQLSSEISDLVSKIREVNDLFELQNE